jgi:GNAT superfamily N-acetyltransferase
VTLSSLYAQYVRERGIDQIIETEKGFATYRYLNEGRTVYIVDIFVLPEHRKAGAAAGIADAIAALSRDKGCTEMLGSVAPEAKGSADSLRVLLAYGMELVGFENRVIVFRKEI